jgi:hypothetical protein
MQKCVLEFHEIKATFGSLVVALLKSSKESVAAVAVVDR